jgi:hypothetical protein
MIKITHPLQHLLDRLSFNKHHAGSTPSNVMHQHGRNPVDNYPAASNSADVLTPFFAIIAAVSLKDVNQHVYALTGHYEPS